MVNLGSLALMLAFIAIMWATIRFTNSGKRLNRKLFAFQFFPAMFGMVLLVAWIEDNSNSQFAIWIAVVGIFVLMEIVRISAHRAQDIGISKWWCLLLFVPVVDLVFALLLVFARGTDQPPRSGPVS